ncbi:transmembrane protein 163a-like [Montipora capricornis]|uniref:transmembrane protein 163a-like n=1 Tax=Montipora capricornis TaxID=246305 RepID=UPI0035F18F1B
MNIPCQRSEDELDGDEDKHTETFSVSEQTLHPSHVRNLTPKLSGNFVAEISPDKGEIEKQKVGHTPCISTMDDNISKDKSKRRLPERTLKQWRKAAIWVTVICIVVSLGITIASFKSSNSFNSSSVLALSFDTGNAFICSLVLLWRFKSTQSGNLGFKKERLACLVFAVSFLSSGTLTTALSIKKIILKDQPDISYGVAAILSIGSILYFTLAALQGYISMKINSSAMLGSSLDSGLSGALMVGLLISDCAFILVHTDLWYLDHSMAILVSIVSILAGVQILVDILVYKALPMDRIK